MGCEVFLRCQCCKNDFPTGGLPSAYCEPCRRRVADKGLAYAQLEIENATLRAELEEWRDLVRRAAVAFARASRTLEPQGDPT